MRTHLSALTAARGIAVTWATSSTIVLAACGGGDTSGIDPATAPRSIAMNAWTPGANDTCTKEIHDAYAVVGPDGKLYPTWHPAVDPGDRLHLRPRAWARSAAGPTSMTRAARSRSATPTSSSRPSTRPTRATRTTSATRSSGRTTVELTARRSASFQIKCDVLTKLHQGTHSKDAFTNNLHELVYHLSCGDGTEIARHDA